MYKHTNNTSLTKIVIYCTKLCRATKEFQTMHIFREQNRLADVITAFSLRQDPSFKYLDRSHVEVLEIIMTDRLGITLPGELDDIRITNLDDFLP